MKSDCRIIGVGLGADEWGLHWMFVQRERNRVRHPNRPHATWFKAAADTLPIGVELSTHSTWREAIEAALEG